MPAAELTPAPAPAARPLAPVRGLPALARSVMARILSRLASGRITIIDGDGSRQFGSMTDGNTLSAVVFVHDPAFYTAVIGGGNVGAGRAYADGLWTADNLTNVIRILAVNQQVLHRIDGAWALLGRGASYLARAGKRNSRRGDRRNIAEHYDLGNDFFASFLDETMTYSCAYFPGEGMSLAEAQRAKLDLICRKLELGPGDHVLEIGGGWGGFAEFAAASTGCRVTTATISAEQWTFARERVRRAGLEDRIEVLDRDYRDLTGTYDRIVSIEMIEAVGAENLDRFFVAVDRLLARDGIMLLQSIVIPDRHYEHARRSVDFIKRYIFPGSFLPSLGALTRAISNVSDLLLVGLEDLTPHYAETLVRWRERFTAESGRIAALGFGAEFQRLWEYYFCYCEGGFRERTIGDVQLLLARPEWRRRSPLRLRSG